MIASPTRLLFLLATLVTIPFGLVGQSGSVEIGQTIRITTKSDSVPVRGRLTDYSATRWDLTTPNGATRAFSAGDIQSIEVWRSKRNAKTGAVVGGLVGLGVGALGAVATDNICDAFSCDNSISAEFFIGSIAVGLGLGVLIGHAIETESWEPVTLPDAAPTFRAGMREWTVGWRIPVGFGRP